MYEVSLGEIYLQSFFFSALEKVYGYKSTYDARFTGPVRNIELNKNE